MDDTQIIELFYKRSENAISKTAEKYGKYCYYIAYSILRDVQDSEECVNDTYLRAWNLMPPQKPNNLQTFLGKITRNLALDRYKYNNRDKRGGGQVGLVLEELDECIPARNDPEQAIMDKELIETLNLFLAGLPSRKRQIFIRRYWYLSPISEIAEEFCVSENNVKVTLFRTRNELKIFLEKAGISI